MWSACCNSIPLFQNKRGGMLSSGIVLIHDNARPHTAAATKRPLKRFRWEVFDHPPSSVRTWFLVIFISFLVWNDRRRRTCWHNELQTSVENWLKAHAADFYDESIGKLVPCCEKCMGGSPCDVSEEPVKSERRVGAHSPTFPSLHLRHSSFSNPSVALPTSSLILQSFRCLTYVTALSPTLLSLFLHQRLFTYVSWRAADGKMFTFEHRLCREVAGRCGYML